MEGFTSFGMQDAEIEDDEKVKIPEKHHKKTFGHHSGKTGLPFCTMEGMGQVSISNQTHHVQFQAQSGTGEADKTPSTYKLIKV